MTELSNPENRSKKNHPAYKNWVHMIYRCHNQSCKRFNEWGGRGIVVCQQWRDDFWSFVHYMGPKPSPKHSIDRIDNNGNYEPGNVRWATARDQTINSSHAVKLTFKGQTLCLKDWAEQLGFSYKCITKRYESGKSVEEILTKPSKKPLKNPAPRGWFYKDKFWGYKELAERFNIPITAMKSRYSKGWSVERAITQPVRSKDGRATIYPKESPET